MSYCCLFKWCNGDKYEVTGTTRQVPPIKTVQPRTEPKTEPEIEEPTQIPQTPDTPDGSQINPLPNRRRSGIIPTTIILQNDDINALPTYPKEIHEEILLKAAFESNEFLNKLLAGKRLENVIEAMYKRKVVAKEIVIKEGEIGSHLYVSASGKFQVSIKGKAVKEINDCQVFGELAILYNAKRLATIKAITAGELWVLDSKIFHQLMLRSNIEEQDDRLVFLQSVEKLNVVGKETLELVSSLLKTEFFTTNTQIVRQGDKGDKFYIIRAGSVTVSKDSEGVVRTLNKSEYFGELALLKEDCRQATVTADAPGVECLTLTRQEFINHFGEVKDIQSITVQVNSLDGDEVATAEFTDVDVRDLKIIATLGVGGFGRVELVQHSKDNSKVFALKYLKKQEIVEQMQQEHVYNEKNIQMACKSPFIVRLYRTYKDKKYVYFLMESCLGGDLWSLLQKQKKKRFEEKNCKFIAGCVLEAIEYLHKRDIAYRDLKPENLLIDEIGYIKLTDFGFAKTLTRSGRTHTFAGTPEYVAPEIVLNRGHDRGVDYWAFGIFIFELFTGRTPFRTNDSSHMRTYNKILAGIDNVQFPPDVPPKAKHIIEKLCRPVATDRLGMQRAGCKDVKAHKFFVGFDWAQLQKCQYPSPFKPKLKNAIDTDNFDQFNKDTDMPPDELSGWDEKF